MKNIYQNLLQEGLIKKEKVNFRFINNLISRSEKSVILARKNFKISSEVAFSLAYESMLMAGRALMFSFGYRPRVQFAHKITVLFVKLTLGEEFEILVKKFDKMRIKRHDLLYEGRIIVSASESEKAISDAEKLINSVKKIIDNMNPQMKIF